MENLKPKKSLGQNFLTDKNIAKKIVDALETHRDDIVIEIGPGTGSLTEFLAEKKCKLFLIEIDSRAIDILKKKFDKFQHIKIIKGDFSEINFMQFPFENSYSSQNINEFSENNRNKIKVIGNIPYYLTSQVLFKLFEFADLIDIAVLTIQREVAQRVVALPGNKTYGILSIAAKISAETQILLDIPPSCFFPPPKVYSSVIKLIFNRKFTKFEFEQIMILVKKAFNQRRKVLRNSLKDELSLIECFNVLNDKSDYSIKKYFDKRPEELSYLDFKILYEFIKKHKESNQ